VERRAGGIAYLELVTELLQRQRLADPVDGLWEAADLQWWFTRDPHPTDDDAVFWLDGGGPVGAVVFTRWGPTRYGCDVLGSPPHAAAWEFVRRRCAELPDAAVEMEALDEAEAARAGFVELAEEHESTWLDAWSAMPWATCRRSGCITAPASVPTGGSRSGSARRPVSRPAGRGQRPHACRSLRSLVRYEYSSGRKWLTASSTGRPAVSE